MFEAGFLRVLSDLRTIEISQPMVTLGTKPVPSTDDGCKKEIQAEVYD